MLGIDIYERYQDVRDWGAVARHGVRFCWVKASDGGRNFRTDPARRPDGLVAGAKAVGILVGLYHYAQLAPSPETQADVLTAEVRRLGATGVPPALDLESPFVPGPAARDFTIRFLSRLLNHHGLRPAVYANTSMFAGIRPDTFNIRGLVIWAADYGANNGTRNPDLRPYVGRADVHQYTSVGTVPGISGRVDLNESLTNFLTEGDDDMTPEQHNMLAKIVGQLDKIGIRTAQAGRHTDAADTIVDIRVLLDRVHTRLAALSGDLSDDEANVLAAVRAQPTGGQVDVTALAAALGPMLTRIPDDQIAHLVDVIPETTRHLLATALAGGTH